MTDRYQWRRVAHIPLIIILQIIFIVLFAKFVVYDEHSAVKNVHFDKGYQQKDAHDAAHGEQREGKSNDPTAEKLTDGEDAPLHETTRDAKEILTDYPSKHPKNVGLKIIRLGCS